MANTINEVQEKVQYPAWQATIRKAQAEEHTRYAEQNAKWAAEELERKLAEIEGVRQALMKHGLELPESTTGAWVVGAYTFQRIERPEYNGYSDSYLAVTKDVPDANPELVEESDDDIWYRSGYRTQCVVEIFWRDVDGASIADAIDSVDQKVGEQIAVNRNVLARMENYRPAPKTAQAPEPSLEERFLALLREMIREAVDKAMYHNEYQ